MMRPVPRRICRAASVFASAALVIALGTSSAFAVEQDILPRDPDSAELVEHPKRYDGTEIEFVGEAIGEAMVRGEFAWIHLNDDAYADLNIEEGAELGGYNSGHAIWISEEEIAEITYYGDYRHEGDIVKVVGTFHGACPEHGGDMDIHAATLEVVRVGHVVDDPIHPSKVVWAALLTAIAGLVWLLLRLVPSRWERKGRAFARR